ncbi:MAG: M23 family metallopeptidase [bacterium]|nr:M23 family metallopeptidase [bacterium]
MRFISLIFIVAIVSVGMCPYVHAATLNQYGHIIADREATATLDHNEMRVTGTNKSAIIQHDGNLFDGNQLYRTSHGHLALSVVEEGVPTTLRVYDTTGQCTFLQTVPCVNNLRMSDNKRYVAFFDGARVVVIDSQTCKLQRYNGNTTFAIDDSGEPVYVNGHSVMYKSQTCDFDDVPLAVIFWQQQPIIALRHAIYQLVPSNTVAMYQSSGDVFDIEVQGGRLWLSERKQNDGAYSYSLYSTSNMHEFTMHESIECRPIRRKHVHIDNKGSGAHATIPAPIGDGTTGTYFRIGNSYAEIQDYGSDPYLHPGVDILATADEPVYAVEGGTVKAVFTTGDSHYWRIAVANTNSATESIGYLYAHLNPDSITCIPGDTVHSGDILGTIVEWFAGYDFTHIHFARIASTGEVWNGQWWTTNNPLVDMYNMRDDIPPAFEAAYGSDLFAFRTGPGKYMRGDDLTNRFDIIVKCSDAANTIEANRRVDVWDIAYSLVTTDGFYVISNQLAYTFDWPLGSYVSDIYDTELLNQVYSRDALCFSIGTYSERDYYHIISNTIAYYPAGPYNLSITIRDAQMNTAMTTMPIRLASIPEVKLCTSMLFCLLLLSKVRYGT